MGRGGYVGMSTAMTVGSATVGSSIRHGVRLTNPFSNTASIAANASGYFPLDGAIEEDPDGYLDVANRRLVIPAGLAGIYVGRCDFSNISPGGSDFPVNTGFEVTNPAGWDDLGGGTMWTTTVVGPNVTFSFGPRALVVGQRVKVYVTNGAVNAQTFRLASLSLYRITA
jgi:hypothetical protein